LTLNLQKPYEYIYSSAARYWDETNSTAFDTGNVVYTLNSTAERPVYAAPHSTYIGYTKTVNGSQTTGSTTTVSLSSSYRTIITWFYYQDVYPYTLYMHYYDSKGDLVTEVNYPLERPHNASSSI
jgi:hypothetical protein